MSKKSSQRTPTRNPRRSKATAQAQPSRERCVVVIRLRGEAGLDGDTRKTLRDLRLLNKYNAAIFFENPAIRGMLQRVKDYVTWGEPETETLGLLLSERVEVRGGGDLTTQLLKDKFQASSVDELASSISNGKVSPTMLSQAGISPRFRLHPPRKGFKRTIKRSYRDRGELGYRGEEINGLLRRMI
jgi:large subunit ribosomal protein L30